MANSNGGTEYSAASSARRELISLAAPAVRALLMNTIPPGRNVWMIDLACSALVPSQPSRRSWPTRSSSPVSLASHSAARPPADVAAVAWLTPGVPTSRGSDRTVGEPGRGVGATGVCMESGTVADAFPGTAIPSVGTAVGCAVEPPAARSMGQPSGGAVSAPAGKTLTRGGEPRSLFAAPLPPPARGAQATVARSVAPIDSPVAIARDNRSSGLRRRPLTACPALHAPSRAEIRHVIPVFGASRQRRGPPRREAHAVAHSVRCAHAFTKGCTP